jgi:hypothetical protein
MWRWGMFSSRTSVSPANLHSTKFSIIITRGKYNRPFSGRRAEWTHLDSTPHHANLKNRTGEQAKNVRFIILIFTLVNVPDLVKHYFTIVICMILYMEYYYHIMYYWLLRWPRNTRHVRSWTRWGQGSRRSNPLVVWMFVRIFCFPVRWTNTPSKNLT